jgi:hypothetical protein
VKKLSMITLIFSLLGIAVNAQIRSYDADFISTLIRTLDETNALRLALESGDRGDGIHYAWMDEMKSFGIKQSSYVFKFKWENGRVRTIKVKQIAYHPGYYKYDLSITNDSKLEQIKSTSLEKTLESEAISRAKRFLTNIISKNKSKSASGTVYVNLLDDERLPILVDMPEIKFKN